MRQKIDVNNNTNTFDDNIQVFSDRTGSTAGVGAGFAVFRNQQLIKQKKIKISKECTLFQAKIFSIKMALSYVCKQINNLSDISIYLCDQSVVGALQNQNSTNDLIFSIYEMYYELMNRNISLGIVQKHYNECNEFRIVRTIAKQAIDSHNRIEYDLIRKSKVIRLIYQKNIELWNERWIECSTGLQTKLFFDNISDRLVVKKYFKTDFYLTQILTNHSKLNQYLNRFNLKASSECDYCGHGMDDANHKLFDCTYFTEQRMAIIRCVESNGQQWPITPNELINEIYFNEFIK